MCVCSLGIHDAQSCLNPLDPITTCALITPWISATRVTYCFTLKVTLFFTQKTGQRFQTSCKTKKSLHPALFPNGLTECTNPAKKSRRCIWMVQGTRILIPGRHMVSVWYGDILYLGYKELRIADHRRKKELPPSHLSSREVKTLIHNKKETIFPTARLQDTTQTRAHSVSRHDTNRQPSFASEQATAD